MTLNDVASLVTIVGLPLAVSATILTAISVFIQGKQQRDAARLTRATFALQLKKLVRGVAADGRALKGFDGDYSGLRDSAWLALPLDQRVRADPEALQVWAVGMAWESHAKLPDLDSTYRVLKATEQIISAWILHPRQALKAARKDPDFLAAMIRTNQH